MMHLNEAEHLVEQLRRHFKRQPLTDSEAEAVVEWLRHEDLGLAAAAVATAIRDDDRMPSVRRLHRLIGLEELRLNPPRAETRREIGLRQIEAQRAALRRDQPAPPPKRGS